ncbi:MAG: VOC family protein [Pirellulaceae bacterium]|nr:VOC family protein [Pirellulaceae bacterium]
MNDIGKIGWIDLACENAVEVRDFYAQVAGWTHTPVPVGDYEDFTVHANGEAQPIAGICHQRGDNASLPSQWLIYIQVADLQQSVQSCTEMGGQVICPVRDLGSYGKMCVIKDPAGAVAALIQSSESATQSD